MELNLKKEMAQENNTQNRNMQKKRADYAKNYYPYPPQNRQPSQTSQRAPAQQPSQYPRGRQYQRPGAAQQRPVYPQRQASFQRLVYPQKSQPANVIRPNIASIPDVDFGSSEPKKLSHVLDKRMIIPIVAIILLLIVGFAGVYFFTSTFEESPVQSPEVSGLASSKQTPEEKRAYEVKICNAFDNFEDYQKGDECFFMLTKKYESAEFCDFMIEESGAISSDACYAFVAKNLRNEKYCYLIENFFGDYSFHSCIVNVARVSNSPELCNVLSVDAQKYSKSACINQFNLNEEEFEEMYSVKEIII